MATQQMMLRKLCTISSTSKRCLQKIGDTRSLANNGSTKGRTTYDITDERRSEETVISNTTPPANEEMIAAKENWLMKEEIVI